MEILTDKIGNTWFVEECDGFFILHHQNRRNNGSQKFHTHVQSGRFYSKKSIMNYIKKHEQKLLIRNVK